MKDDNTMGYPWMYYYDNKGRKPISRSTVSVDIGRAGRNARFEWQAGCLLHFGVRRQTQRGTAFKTALSERPLKFLTPLNGQKAINFL
ncbi:hypothetical protein [Limihaloglobus sulfuriphilus]|uniref:hypothetical protein n=1 Tax=Limihaloglobus sulfuriphilus TaxID=1851148 RepID=UPI0011BAA98F|nr:hypothetical protein [Limihaloglobus sulfuriphilus]